jgi:hypothetical protein
MKIPIRQETRRNKKPRQVKQTQGADGSNKETDN